MSDTRKDSASMTPPRIVLEVVANGDGTFEITFNQRLVGSRVAEQWLYDEVCAKYGFCGEEFVSIKRELDEHGRAVVTL